MLGKISACLMAILLSASCVIGQSTFGSIVGVVKDPAERTIADAQITLTNLDDHAQRNTSADSNGAFEFVNLKPGTMNWWPMPTAFPITESLPCDSTLVKIFAWMLR